MGVSAAHYHKGNEYGGDGTPRIDFDDLTGTEGVRLWGNLLFVDSVYGNDSTGERERKDLPYLTIEAALADAAAGDAVWVLPGTYSPVAGLTMPDDVLLRGIGTGAVKVQMLGVTADTTLLTMGENSRVEDMALKLTSSEHHTLKGVVFPGTTSATAKLRTATVLVDNSGAGAGASEVYGVHSTGTGSPGVETSAIRAVTVTVASAGTGNKRGILVDAANKFNVRDTNVKVSGGGASNIGVETNHASAEFHAATGVFSGTTASISQTAGILAISSVDLVESSANGIGFTADSVSFGATWADPGGLPGGGARYMRPGTATVSVTEVFLRVPRKAVIKTLSVRATAAPGAGKNTVFTVRKNGVDTILTATLSGTALTVEDLTHSVAFASGDSISVSEVNDAGSVVSDVVVTVEIY